MKLTPNAPHPNFGHVTGIPEGKGCCVAMVRHRVTSTPLTACETPLHVS